MVDVVISGVNFVKLDNCDYCLLIASYCAIEIVIVLVSIVSDDIDIVEVISGYCCCELLVEVLLDIFPCCCGQL